MDDLHDFVVGMFAVMIAASCWWRGFSPDKAPATTTTAPLGAGTMIRSGKHNLAVPSRPRRSMPANGMRP
jgi:hypothetical protein